MPSHEWAYRLALSEISAHAALLLQRSHRGQTKLVTGAELVIDGRYTA